MTSIVGMIWILLFNIPYMIRLIIPVTLGIILVWLVISYFRKDKNIYLLGIFFASFILLSILLPFSPFSKLYKMQLFYGKNKDEIESIIGKYDFGYENDSIQSYGFLSCLDEDNAYYCNIVWDNDLRYSPKIYGVLVKISE